VAITKAIWLLKNYLPNVNNSIKKTSMNIGIDVMGGDLAPAAVVDGAILAKQNLSNQEKIVLIGDENLIKPLLDKHQEPYAGFEIVHTDQYIEMGENPAKAIAQKKQSSISVGYKLLKEGRIDAFSSAGNTGAMLFAAMYSVKSIPGVIRPCITAFVPVEEGGPRIILDVGINPDCRPDVLYQYAVLGSLYLKIIHNVDNPSVALLNIGEEEEKGNLMTKNAYQIMKEATDISFKGNIEGNEIFDNNKANVIVCDGFVGNVIIKEAEAFYKIIRKKGIKDDYFEQFNSEKYGGTPVLGINKTVVIGHGISNQYAIQNMLLLSKDIVERELSEKIKEALN
jgi:glycerol-3-phosphate acyltransferase PlsX